MSETPQKTITVYTRLAGDDEQSETRRLTFRIPDDINPTDLLEYSFAIDGNQAAGDIAQRPDGDGFEGPFLAYDNGWPQSLMIALADSQRAIVNYLEEHGYKVNFS